MSNAMFFVFVVLAAISAKEREPWGFVTASLFAIKFALDSAAWLIIEEKKSQVTVSKAQAELGGI